VLDFSSWLTHLFWMSPRQREMALDVYQVLIHDNTYKTNTFKLPCGLYLAPNRHGQIVLLAVSLSAKEGAEDYKWQLEQCLEAVTDPPCLVLTDADPGVTASLAEVFPSARHLWCLWHIL